MGWVASGHVNCEGELLRYPELSDQPFKRLAQVSYGFLAGSTFAVSAYAGTQLGVSAPHTVFILFDGVRNVHGPRHRPRLLASACSS